MAAKKRSEAMASAQQRTIPLPIEGEREEKTQDSNTTSSRLPIENDFSKMSIEIKARGFVAGPRIVAEWTAEQRHLVAMWLTGSLAAEDVPAVIAKCATTPVTTKQEETSKPAKVASPEPAASFEVRSSIESVTMKIPEDVYSPAQYNNFCVGGFSATTSLRTGESHVDAGRRIGADLQVLYDEQFKTKSETFLRNLKRLKSDLAPKAAVS